MPAVAFEFSCSFHFSQDGSTLREFPPLQLTGYLFGLVAFSWSCCLRAVFDGAFGSGRLFLFVNEPKSFTPPTLGFGLASIERNTDRWKRLRILGALDHSRNVLQGLCGS